MRPKILMATPVPFFSPRGTAFSTLSRCRALIDLGYDVDLLTYPFGDDIRMKGLRIFRTVKPPFMRSIGLGLSPGMFILDALLSFKLFFWKKKGYAYIHAHEETVFSAVLCKRISGLPLLYDMHSSIPEQLSNFRTTKNRLLIRLLAGLEKWAIRNSDAVIVICKDLEDTVKRVGRTMPVLIENLPVGYDAKPDRKKKERIIQEFSLGGKKVVVYTGTLGVNQGIEMLISSARLLRPRKDIVFLIVGGEADRIAALENQAQKEGVGERFIFTGQRRPEEMVDFESLADCLVSPRVEGTNTPLKIYSYMRSGRPIVATDLWTHTQVLDSSIAILVKPTPAAFAAGIRKAIGTSQGKAVANKALAASKSFSYPSFVEKTRTSVEAVLGH